MATEGGAAKTILVVEDNDITREGLATVLRREGYSVTTAENGHQALGVLGTDPPPDLILLDMLMPVLDGWHFLDRLKRSPRKFIPVVVTTGTILTPEWATQHGCAGFIKKPVEAAELLTEIRRVLGQAHA